LMRFGKVRMHLHWLVLPYDPVLTSAFLPSCQACSIIKVFLLAIH